MTKGWKVCFQISHKQCSRVLLYIIQINHPQWWGEDSLGCLSPHSLTLFLKIHIIVSSSSWVYLFLMLLHSWTVLPTCCNASFVSSNNRLACRHESSIAKPTWVSNSALDWSCLRGQSISRLSDTQASCGLCLAWRALLDRVTVIGEYPGCQEIPAWAGSWLPGTPGIPSPAPCSQSTTELPQTDKQNKAQRKQLEPKQTDLGEFGRGFRPGVIQALGQAVVLATASRFISGQQSQFSEGEARRGGCGAWAGCGWGVGSFSK